MSTREYIIGIIGAVVGGWASAAWTRSRREDLKVWFLLLLQAEYRYWFDAAEAPVDKADDVAAGIHMGAMGSVSNVMAALHGKPAPWHPKQDGKEVSK